MRFILFLVFTILIHHSFSQNKNITFYEVIKDDSVVMFFNEQGHFVEKNCADYYRYVRIDNNGDFNSRFVDVNNQGIIRGTGNYVHGKREEKFEIYYSDGKTQSKGYYENNLPTGIWNFFYENGLPERTLKISKGDTLLMRFVSSDGKILVENGKGIFNGPVGSDNYGVYNTSKRLISKGGVSAGRLAFVTVKGKVKNGKPDKWWATPWHGHPSYLEKFSKGKFIRGSSASSLRDGNYRNYSKLSNFFYCDYFKLLENML